MGKLRVSPSVAFLGGCGVVCVVIGVAGYLQGQGQLTPAFWTTLAAFLASLGNLVQVEGVGKEVTDTAAQVQVVAEHTNGTNTRLQRAALTALAELPPDRARDVLDRLDVTGDPLPPIAQSGEPPIGGYGEPPPRTGG